MATFREQMQQLADNIARSRSERKTFVVKNQRDREKMRHEVALERGKTKRDLAKQSRSLVKSLTDFNRDNQKGVARTLKDSRQGRISKAKAFKHSLRQEIAKNSRYVARLLRQNYSDRKRNQRQHVRECTLTIQSVQKQVQRIRTATNRMTRSLANDRQAARLIWSRLQHANSARQADNTLATTRAIESLPPIDARPPIESLPISKTIPTRSIPTPMPSFSGLAIPPSPY